jgi:hypothetical protein
MRTIARPRSQPRRLIHTRTAANPPATANRGTRVRQKGRPLLVFLLCSLLFTVVQYRFVQIVLCDFLKEHSYESPLRKFSRTCLSADVLQSEAGNKQHQTLSQFVALAVLSVGRFPQTNSELGTGNPQRAQGAPDLACDLRSAQPLLNPAPIWDTTDGVNFLRECIGVPLVLYTLGMKSAERKIPGRGLQGLVSRSQKFVP